METWSGPQTTSVLWSHAVKQSSTKLQTPVCHLVALETAYLARAKGVQAVPDLLLRQLPMHPARAVKAAQTFVASVVLARVRVCSAHRAMSL